MAEDSVTTAMRGTTHVDLDRADDRGRGREATVPEQIPARGWRDILWRVKDELARDSLSMLAAGVAYYAFLAMFPGMVALVAIYGLIADPADIRAQLTSIAGLLPEEARGIMAEQLEALTGEPAEKLGIGAVIAVVLALWSASSGVKALMQMMNVAYDEVETRGFFRFNLTALGLTLGAMVMLIAALVTVVVIPVLLKFLGLDEALKWLIAIARWPVLGAMVMLGLAVLYRYGPSRDAPQWRWVTWGAVATTVLWLAGSAAFSLYVSSFGSFDKTYGSLGAVVILLLWLNITAYLIGLRAEINAEMEHQTAQDTTAGPEKPLGERGATVADTVGHVP